MLPDHVAVGCTPNRKRDRLVFGAILTTEAKILVDQHFRRRPRTRKPWSPIEGSTEKGWIVEKLLCTHDALTLRCLQVLKDVSRRSYVAIREHRDLQCVSDGSDCTEIGGSFTVLAFAAQQFASVNRQQRTSGFLQELGKLDGPCQCMLQTNLAANRNAKVCTSAADRNHLGNHRPLMLIVGQPSSISALSSSPLRAAQIEVDTICPEFLSCKSSL
mmetsp:Transcript_50528/g.120473  ORF Transcript_50528/g.120473 Transcript_50528/m.120473 type:complete len:216 (-) Transcript_50528:272-919(-)